MLTCFNAVEKWLYFERLTDDEALPSISEVETGHPTEEACPLLSGIFVF